MNRIRWILAGGALVAAAALWMNRDRLEPIPRSPASVRSAAELAIPILPPQPQARRTAPLRFPAVKESLEGRLESLEPACRRLALAAVKTDVQELGYRLRYESDMEGKALPPSLTKAFDGVLTAGRCGSLKSAELKKAYDFFRRSCSVPPPATDNFDERFNQYQACLLGLRLWRSEVAAYAYRGVPLERITDPGIVSLLLEGQFATLAPRPSDLRRTSALARRLSDLLPEGREAAVLWFQAAYLASVEDPGEGPAKELEEAKTRMGRLAPDNTRLMEAELARVATAGDADALEEAAERIKRANPDSFLGPYYTAYSLAPREDRDGAKRELEAYLAEHPTSTLVAQALSILIGASDVDPRLLFIDHNRALFLEQFDADEVTGEIPYALR